MYGEGDYGSANVVEFFIHNNIGNIDARYPTSPWCNPLHFAASVGHCDVVCVLLDNGATETPEGRAMNKSPLSTALNHNHTEIAALLTLHGFTA